MDNLAREEKGHWIFARYIRDDLIERGWDDKWKIITEMSRQGGFMMPIVDSRRVGSTQEYAIKSFNNLKISELFRLSNYKNVEIDLLHNLHYASNCFQYGIPWQMNEFIRTNHPSYKIRNSKAFYKNALVDSKGAIVVVDYFSFELCEGMDDYMHSPLLFSSLNLDAQFINDRANVIQAKLVHEQVQKEVIKKEFEKTERLRLMTKDMSEKLKQSVRLSKLKQILSEAEYEYIIGADSDY